MFELRINEVQVCGTLRKVDNESATGGREEEREGVGRDRRGRRMEGGKEEEKERGPRNTTVWLVPPFLVWACTLLLLSSGCIP